MTKKSKDPNKAAKHIIDALDGKDPAAVSLGRKGGLKGGKARAKALTAQERKEIARLGGQARWKKK